MGLFSKPTRESVAVIDIGSSSVGGGLVHYQQGQAPVMCYTARVALGSHAGSELTNAMLRALEEVGGRLVREGAPQLRQTAGSGSVDRIVVSISSPWQTSHVESKQVRNDGQFTYTRTLERETLEADDRASDNCTVVKSIMATYLNGYTTKNPYDQKVSRAEIVVLTSILETPVIEEVGTALRKHFHSKNIAYTGFATPAFTVLRKLYPHEKDVLIVAVTGEGTDVASVKRDHLVDVGSAAQGTNALIEAIRLAGKSASAAEPVTAGAIDPERNARFASAALQAEHDWLAGLMKLLREFAGRHALPRTLFLIAEDEVRGFVKQQLEDPSLHGLWLSDEPINVIPVLPSQFTPYLRITGVAEGDLALDLLALFASPVRKA